MEDEALPFHQRIRAGFLALAQQEPSRWRVVDSSRPPEIVQTEIWAAVHERLEPGLSR